jgi:hypothetical protein
MSIVYRQNTPLSIGVDVTVDVKSDMKHKHLILIWAWLH